MDGAVEQMHGVIGLLNHSVDIESDPEMRHLKREIDLIRINNTKDRTTAHRDSHGTINTANTAKSSSSRCNSPYSPQKSPKNYVDASPPKSNRNNVIGEETKSWNF